MAVKHRSVPLPKMPWYEVWSLVELKDPIERKSQLYITCSHEWCVH